MKLPASITWAKTSECSEVKLLDRYILAELIPVAKANYNQYRNVTERPGIKRAEAKNVGYTVDTPVPYRLADLLAIIDERMGKLENRSSRMIYQRLITRIETVSRTSTCDKCPGIWGAVIPRILPVTPDG